SILIVKNWSVPHNEYHRRIKDAITGCLLRKHGFNVCLFDEFSTSRHCPSCSQSSL
ncbi:hypothetical protein J3Q64DRAFT_1649195, partial [Phycomyces blakesleeanus]